MKEVGDEFFFSVFFNLNLIKASGKRRGEKGRTRLVTLNQI